MAKLQIALSLVHGVTSYPGIRQSAKNSSWGIAIQVRGNFADTRTFRAWRRKFCWAVNSAMGALLNTRSNRQNIVGSLSSLSAASAGSIALTSLSIAEPGVRRLNMSTLLELERMQQHVARLRRRIKNQTRYIEALGDYPDIAKRASDVLARESEELRSA